MGHLGLYIAFACLALPLISAGPTGQPGQGGWLPNWQEEARRSFESELLGEYKWIDTNARLSRVESKWQMRHDSKALRRQMYQVRLRTTQQYQDSEKAAARKRLTERKAQWEKPFNEDNYPDEHWESGHWSAQEINDIILNKELAQILTISQNRRYWARQRKNWLVQLLGQRRGKDAESNYQERRRAIDEVEDVARMNARIRHQSRANRILEAEQRKGSTDDPTKGENPPDPSNQSLLSSLGEKVGHILEPLGKLVRSPDGVGLGHNSFGPVLPAGALRPLIIP
ncbi:MAG: hypothetical protein M1816_002037 [Peltula sp. TS41687]|nr:MAG: hypothetical protein M1816_002037 [Peltula sp. TS41687]